MNAGRTLGLVILIAVGALTLADCSRRREPETEDRGRTQPTVVDAPDMGADDRRDAEEAARRARTDAMAAINEPIYFDFDQSDLHPEARDVLNRKADALRDYPDVRIRVEGHCDERGTVEYNLALGERRADAARAYLIDLGIDPDRITTISYGEERPSVEGQSEAAWSQNRRDEFVVISG